MNQHDPQDRRMARRAAFGSFLGSTVEYYDFFIYGSAAALVFNKLFFPSDDPMAGTLAALATFGVGYIARPIGALLFGHLGDRIGRKQVLMMTLLMMGIATFAIGLLPTHSMIGAWAPALLVACRLLQGLSAGGEQVGASLLTMEHAPGKHKAFYTSWLINGASVGSILATSVFIPLSMLSEEQLLSWGWRIPFLLSAVMVAITWLIRRGVDESPEFAAKQKQSAPAHIPVAELFSKEWRAFIVVFCCALICAVSSLVMIFGLSWATNNQGVDRPSMLSAIAASQFVALICQPLCGLLADRIGKKFIFVAGSLACCGGVFLFLWSITTGQLWLIMASTILLKAGFYSAPNALWPSFYAEMFSIRVRYTGVGLATQLSFIISGFSPSICYALLGKGDLGWLPVGYFIGGLALAAAIAALLSRPASEPSEAARYAPVSSRA